MRLPYFSTKRKRLGSTLVVPPIELPPGLWSFSDATYLGGFRVDHAIHGYNAASTTDGSRAAFTISESGNSIFIAGMASESQIGEFTIPALVNTYDRSLMNIGQVVQDFSIFKDPGGRYDPGFTDRLRQTGMLAIDGKLIVNYYDWYDADGNETDTTAIYQDAANLATTSIVGPFQMDGAAHSAGWISPVPAEWQVRLGATHVSGWMQGSINGRLSNGPSAWFWNPEDYIDEVAGTQIATVPGLDFPLDNILYDKSKYTYDGTFTNNEIILLNDDRNNDLWTYLSGAGYGFIIPGTDTYMTVGYSGGHVAGVGYKVLLPSGVYSTGHAPRDGLDYNYGFYWLWDVNDIEDAKNGVIETYDVRPYEYGPLNTIPFIGAEPRVISGSFDPSTGKLYLSIYLGDQVGNYTRPPLFLVYQIISV